MQKLLRDIITRSKKPKFVVAQEIGVGRMTLLNWTKGTTNPVSKTHQRAILKIAKKYEVKTSD